MMTNRVASCIVLTGISSNFAVIISSFCSFVHAAMNELFDYVYAQTDTQTGQVARALRKKIQNRPSPYVQQEMILQKLIPFNETY